MCLLAQCLTCENDTQWSINFPALLESSCEDAKLASWYFITYLLQGSSGVDSEGEIWSTGIRHLTIDCIPVKLGGKLAHDPNGAGGLRVKPVKTGEVETIQCSAQWEVPI